MFKGKKSLYILLPVNLLVWGFIGYKIVMAFQGDDVPEPVETSANFNSLNEKDTLTYQLSLNYEDPFLKQEPARRSHASNYNTSGNQQPAAQKPVKPTAVEPKPQKEIKYLGTIQNKTSGVMMALISINGNSYTIKKGDAVEGFSIKNITSSFIEIKEGKKSFRVDKG